MQVSIIGAGNMGRALGMGFTRGGHDVHLLDRNRERADALAAEVQAQAQEGAAVTAGTLGDPIQGDVVVLAVPYGAVDSVVGQYASQLSGKVVVDITNPINFETFDGLATPPGSSAPEEIATLVPEARVVKAFNTTFAGTLLAGEVAGQQLDVFVAGDDSEAKRKVMQLVEAGGQRPIDAGPLRRARELDALGFLHIAVQQSLGSGFMSTIKLHW